MYKQLQRQIPVSRKNGNDSEGATWENPARSTTIDASKQGQDLPSGDSSPQVVAQRQQLHNMLGGVIQSKSKPPANNTGLPDDLKSGVESLSGFSMDKVKVHYNSSRPVQLNALAYAQGTDIHMAPGQEKHLAHEAWHVVQQAQGRVQPTMQRKDGVAVNDDKGLEREADVMGERAFAMSAQRSQDRAAQDYAHPHRERVSGAGEKEPMNFLSPVSLAVPVAVQREILWKDNPLKTVEEVKKQVEARDLEHLRYLCGNRNIALDKVIADLLGDGIEHKAASEDELYQLINLKITDYEQPSEEEPVPQLEAPLPKSMREMEGLLKTGELDWVKVLKVATSHVVHPNMRPKIQLVINLLEAQAPRGAQATLLDAAARAMVFWDIRMNCIYEDNLKRVGQPGALGWMDDTNRTLHLAAGSGIQDGVVASTLLHELTHLALINFYNNDSIPYKSERDAEATRSGKEKFQQRRGELETVVAEWTELKAKVNNDKFEDERLNQEIAKIADNKGLKQSEVFELVKGKINGLYGYGLQMIGGKVEHLDEKTALLKKRKEVGSHFAELLYILSVRGDETLAWDFLTRLMPESVQFFRVIIFDEIGKGTQNMFK